MTQLTCKLELDSMTARTVPSSDTAARSDQATQPTIDLYALPDETRCGRRWRILESLAVLLAGTLLMHFFYAGPQLVAGAPKNHEIGMPGHDSFYHTKMAALMPQLGVIDRLPWLRNVYWMQEGDKFVSHHFGFHVLLMPFVQASYAVTGDYMPGARWGICVFFGLALMIFNALLMTARVPYRWLWLILFLFMPYQFFTRHAFVRAIAPSLMLMLLLLWTMFQQPRTWRGKLIISGLTGLAVWAYGLLYLGAVMYSPVLVATFFCATFFGRQAWKDRELATWTIITAGCGALGWLLGVLTYPYQDGMFEFLYLQVFGTGLTADIEVGREWQPYNGIWWFVKFVGVLMSVWIAALVTRLRFGPPLDRRELTLLILHFAFLVLTLKSRRFIEYWPVLALLSAAYLSAPVLRRFAAWLRRGYEAHTGEPRPEEPLYSGLLRIGFYMLLGIVGAALVWRSVTTEHLQQFAAAEPLFIALVAYAAVMVFAHWWETYGPPVRRVGAAMLALGVTAAAIGGTTTYAIPQFERVRNEVNCYYDLPAIARMMEFIKQRSEPGDIIFTDDWDVFGVFFYHNSYNHYLVGLDPKFTEFRRPDLWERYVRITRAQTPRRSTVQMPQPDGTRVEKTIHIEQSDIRDVFGAKWVIVDRDHEHFAKALLRDKANFELVYPGAVYADVGDEPFVVFRVHDQPRADVAADPSAMEIGGVLYLSRLEPVHVQQGWGHYQVNRSVSGGPLTIEGRRHLHGIGTHAPSVIEFEVPKGYAFFEATVGLDDHHQDCGSFIASVELDGRTVFTSTLLTPESGAATVRVPLRGAKRLVLRANPTEDGQRCDHVDWGSARLIHGQAAPL